MNIAIYIYIYTCIYIYIIYIYIYTYIYIYSNIHIYIYIYIYIKRRYEGRKLYVGGGEAAAFPPQLLFMRGSAPQTPHILLNSYFWAPQKDAEWKNVYRNGRMSSSSLTVNWFMTKTLLEIWTQLRTEYVVPSAWYQTLGTKHYNIRSYNV